MVFSLRSRLTLCALSVVLTSTHAAEPVPTKLAMQVMLKVLTYDRHFAEHGNGPFTVLLAYEPGQQADAEHTLASLRELNGSRILGRELKFVAESFHTEAQLREHVTRHAANALLATSGLSKPGLGTISAVARDRQLYTLSLDPALVEDSLALSVDNLNGRPQIVLNLAASKSANASFEPTVLKLAKLVEPR